MPRALCFFFFLFFLRALWFFQESTGHLCLGRVCVLSALWRSGRDLLLLGCKMGSVAGLAYLQLGRVLAVTQAKPVLLCFFSYGHFVALLHFFAGHYYID